MADDAAPAPLQVTDVTEKGGETDGRKWTCYAVTFSDGRSAWTFSHLVADIARVSQKHALAVVEPVITLTDKGRSKLEDLALAPPTNVLPAAPAIGSVLLQLVTDLSRIRRQVDVWRTMALTLLNDLTEAQQAIAAIDGSLAARYAKLEAERFTQVVGSYNDRPRAQRDAA